MTAESSPRQVVIAGAGFAAVNAIEALREAGYDGRILLAGEEPELPYDRPPLSKEYLKGDQGLSAIVFHDADWYRAQNVDCELGSAIASLDLASRRVTLASGAAHRYDRLLLTTGARPRTLHGPFEQAGVALHYLRSRGDADRLRSLAGPGRHLVLVGGGVIGMEAAATLTQMGCRVTVLEVAERVMARFFPAELSDWLAGLHRDVGVDVRTGVVVTGVEKSGGGAVIRLQDGACIEADAILAGVGVVPNADLAEQAGLPIRLQGVEVDLHGRTADVHVYAAGDVAAFEMGGQWTRWENWTHARHQSRVAAKNLLGAAIPYQEVPWVWSHQYAFNLQVTGAPHGDAIVWRGDPATGRFTVFHLKDERIVGATSVNEARYKGAIRKLVEAGVRVRPEILADLGVDLKKLPVLA